VEKEKGRKKRRKLPQPKERGQSDPYSAMEKERKNYPKAQTNLEKLESEKARRTSTR